MAEDNPVVASLNGVYRPALTAFEQLHRQEHRFGSKFGYKKLAGKYDKLVHSMRRVRHHVLKRIERLGGEADSTIEPVKVHDEVDKAFDATHKALGRIKDGISQASAVAQSANDHPTHKLMLKLSSKIDKHMHGVERHKRQLKDLGDTYHLTAI
jgi:bacterioferritin (cytochrome b1)